MVVVVVVVDVVVFVFVFVVVVALDVVVTVGGAAVAVEGIQHLHAPRQMISVSEARKVKGKEALTEQTPPCTVQAKVALSQDLLAFTSIFYFFISFLWPQEEVSLSALRFYSILYCCGNGNYKSC